MCVNYALNNTYADNKSQSRPLNHKVISKDCYLNFTDFHPIKPTNYNLQPSPMLSPADIS